MHSASACLNLAESNWHVAAVRSNNVSDSIVHWLTWLTRVFLCMLTAFIFGGFSACLVSFAIYIVHDQEQCMLILNTVFCMLTGFCLLEISFAWCVVQVIATLSLTLLLLSRLLLCNGLPIAILILSVCLSVCNTLVL